MMKKILFILVAVVAVLASGCASIIQSAAPFADGKTAEELKAEGK